MPHPTDFPFDAAARSPVIASRLGPFARARPTIHTHYPLDQHPDSPNRLTTAIEPLERNPRTGIESTSIRDLANMLERHFPEQRQTATTTLATLQTLAYGPFTLLDGASLFPLLGGAAPGRPPSPKSLDR